MATIQSAVEPMKATDLSSLQMKKSSNQSAVTTISSVASSHASSFAHSESSYVKRLIESPLLSSPTFLWAISVSVICLITLIIFLITQRFRKRNRKLRELRYLTPDSGLSSNRLALGIKPGQAIEFVVPTITVPGSTPCSNIEDSFTDSDCMNPFTSGSDREYLGQPMARLGRKRHLTGQYTLSPNDISRSLYDFTGLAGEKVPGKVTFVLHYNIHRQRLLVTLLTASDLPLSEKRSILNPSAKLTLLPDNDPKFVTKVHKNTKNPVFNELFVFPARKDKLDEVQLKITIMDNDRFSRKYFIGQCLYPISESGIRNGINSDVITDEIYCNLSTQKMASSPGELQVSLCYRLNEATLTLIIMKAKNLIIKDIASVYPKVSLYLGKKRIGSKKSPVRKAYSSIDFNDSFHVHIKDTAIDNVNVVVSLVGRTSIGLNTRHSFGKIYLGDNCYSSNGALHWAEMIKSSPNPVVKWHQLK